MTFICNSKKFIFIHLHKCGGTSVERSLDDIMQWNDIMLGSTKYGESVQSQYNDKFGIFKHSSALKTKDLVGDEIWDQYFTFSVVRHPIDRIVSYYSYLKTYYFGLYKGSAIRLMYQLDKANLVPPALTRIPKLYDAFRWPAVVAYLESSNISDFIHSEECWKADGARPQFNQLSDEIGSDIIVDKICKLEEIDNDWQHICQKIGISTKLPHSNKSKRKYKDWRKFFDLDDLNFLEEKYKKDLELFNYSI